jgi:hypothetical protein
MSRHLDAALASAAKGWPVLPLHHPVAGRCSCGRECASPAKHPMTRNGLDDASTDAGQVAAWFTEHPSANVGLRTGVAFDVLDLDHADPLEATAAWPAVDMPGGPVVRTGKGWHFYVLPTGLGNKARLGGPCDWRGRGGYVIAPPSVHISGSTYEWYSSADLALNAAPAALLELLTPPARAAVLVKRPAHASGRGGWSATGLIRTLLTAGEGRRNDVLNWAAHTVGEDVRAGKVDEARAIVALDDLYDTALAIGLTDRESDATIRSGYSRGVAA